MSVTLWWSSQWHFLKIFLKGIKIKIAAKFRASRRRRYEDPKRIMSPVMPLKGFGTFGKRAPGPKYKPSCELVLLNYELPTSILKQTFIILFFVCLSDLKLTETFADQDPDIWKFSWILKSVLFVQILQPCFRKAQPPFKHQKCMKTYGSLKTKQRLMHVTHH